MIPYKNIRGLNNNKTDEFSFSPHVFFVTEQHLHSIELESIA